jgi:ACR3 family arsenite transporter
VASFKPVTIAALLATLVLIFVFQGQRIGQKPLDIVLLAIPITIQCCLNFGIAYAAGFASCIPHERTAPASLIATSNFFELAVAVAISVYGLDSGAALATVVGVLVEVPVMLSLVWVCGKLRPALERRCGVCAEVCGWSVRAHDAVAAAASRAACCN